MKRLFSALALAATAALIWQSVTPAQACSCIAPTSDRATFYTSNARIVLVGTVNEIVETEQRGLPDFDLRVAVETYLKGSGPTEIIADDPIGGGDCGMFDASYVGKRYVFFFWDDQEEFRTGLCSGNTPASGEFIQQVITAAGTSPMEPIPSADRGDGSERDIAFAIAAVAISLLFVLAASLVFPPRGSR